MASSPSKFRAAIVSTAITCAVAACLFSSGSLAKNIAIPYHGGGHDDHDHDHEFDAELACNQLAIDSDEVVDNSLRIGSLFIILVTSGIGALVPIIAQRLGAAKSPVFQGIIDFGLFFGAGVILATGLIHMFPGAVSALTNKCAPTAFKDSYTAFASLFAMLAMLIMHLIEYVAVAYAMKHSRDQHGHDHEHSVAHGHSAVTAGAGSGSAGSESGNNTTDGNADADENCPANMPLAVHHSHAHVHGALGISQGLHVGGSSSETAASIRARISTYVLELGIALHSVIIGITLGVTGQDEFKTLLAAIVFHQCFEGMALGARISSIFLSPAMNRYELVSKDSELSDEIDNEKAASQSNSKQQSARAVRSAMLHSLMNALFFIITTPIGVAIGIGITSTYRPNSQSALLTQGIFDALSAGILIYTALVSLMAEEFSGEKFARKTKSAKTMAFIALYLGAAAMAIIGIWA
ncbi:ZIP zinc/iron transport family [Ramicandelaber brevisporus]|nr:ZIP zinc/iron transport family [Ramicandelaber brevisporus]